MATHTLSTDLPLDDPARLTHFLRGVQITYKGFASPGELEILLRGASALFGKNGNAEDAALFLLHFPNLVAKQAAHDGVSLRPVWPLYSALLDRQSTITAGKEDASSSSGNPNNEGNPPTNSVSPISNSTQKPRSLSSPSKLPVLSSLAKGVDSAAASPQRSQTIKLLASASESIRIVSPTGPSGPSVLLVDIGGFPMTVLPDGQVLVDEGFDTYKVYDLMGKRETHYTHGLAPSSRVSRL